jgi:hypothetical protein
MENQKPKKNLERPMNELNKWLCESLSKDAAAMDELWMALACLTGRVSHARPELVPFFELLTDLAIKDMRKREGRA